MRIRPPLSRLDSLAFSFAAVATAHVNPNLPHSTYTQENALVKTCYELAFHLSSLLCRRFFFLRTNCKCGIEQRIDEELFSRNMLITKMTHKICSRLN